MHSGHYSGYRVRYVGWQRHGFLWLRKSPTWYIQEDNGDYGWTTRSVCRSETDASAEYWRFAREPK